MCVLNYIFLRNIDDVKSFVMQLLLLYLYLKRYYACSENRGIHILIYHSVRNKDLIVSYSINILNSYMNT